MCTAKQTRARGKKPNVGSDQRGDVFQRFFCFFLWELGTTTGRREADFEALCLSGRIRDFSQRADAHSWSKLEDP